MQILRVSTLAAVCLGAAGSVPARADSVTRWNEIASQSIATAIAAGRPGPATTLDFAMVQGAVHDAVQAYQGRYEPYAIAIAGASGSPDAAVARAAHDVLVARFPVQAGALGATYAAYLAERGLDPTDPGVAVGQQAAAAMIALRTGDGSFPSPAPPPFVGGTAVGQWRPTPSFQPGAPPSNAPMAIPWLGAVQPFALASPDQFRPGPPPPVHSGQYAQDYNEVKAMGARFNSDRSPAQTDLAYFWAENFVAQWNRAARALAAAHVEDLGDSARMFALVNFAMADAAITAWDSKRHFVFWRPVTAIHEGDADGNPRTDGDTEWQPLINTPNYPDYTSGANNLTGAATRALALFFGTNTMDFVVTSTHPLVQQGTRTYGKFSEPAEEVVEARIFLGIHFRLADTVARRQGRNVAEWVFGHVLQPVD